jgi:hypothetical protein
VRKMGSLAIPRRVRLAGVVLSLCLIRYVFQQHEIGSSDMPRDASNAHGATIVEPVCNFVTKNKRSVARSATPPTTPSMMVKRRKSIPGVDKDADDSDGLFHIATIAIVNPRLSSSITGDGGVGA